MVLELLVMHKQMSVSKPVIICCSVGLFFKTARSTRKSVLKTTLDFHFCGLWLELRRLTRRG